MASTSPEKETLRKCTAEINKALTYNTDLIWFANRLFAERFITDIQKSNVQSIGVGDYSKASKLMESVMAQVSITPSKYDEFLGILEEEPALDDLVKLLNKTYATIMEEPHSDSQSVPRKRRALKQPIKCTADDDQTTSTPTQPRRRKGPAADQPSNSSSNAASSVSSSSGTSPAPPKSKGPLLFFLIVVIIGGVVAGVWLLGSHYDVVNLVKPHSDNEENKNAPKHKPDCHPIEDVSVVRDELRSVTDWKTLGEELKVPHEVLENIDSNNPRAERKLVETIHKWFNFMEKPCWEMVVKALKRMLLKKLASEIAGRHGVNYNEA